MKYFFLITLIWPLFSCNSKNSGKEVVKIRKQWLDSIIKKSDTSWTKPYRNKEYVMSDYYVDKKDSIVTQIMRDSLNTIRQILIAKYDMRRKFYGEYYSNGQLMALLPLDSMGRYNGEARQYYEDGRIKAEGNYYQGFFAGKWSYYSKSGKFLRMEEYDSSGTLKH